MIYIMNNTVVNKDNFDKFIFKGSLALESYYDESNENKEIFDAFNEKLKAYRQLTEKNDNDKEIIVNELISTIENIGIDKFVIYDDGDVEYLYNNEEGDEI